MDIAYLIRHPEDLNSETLHQLRELVACFPYYQAARLLYLQNLFLLHDPTFDQELRRAALYLPNRRLLFNMVHGRQYELHLPQKKEANTPTETPDDTVQGGDRTASLISNFLRDAGAVAAKTGKSTKYPVTASPSSDYMSYLFQSQGIDDNTDGLDLLGLTISPQKHKNEIKETAAELNSTTPLAHPESDRMVDLITSFIDKGKSNERLQIDHNAPPPTDGEDFIESENETFAPEEGCCTATLARIYIKQGKYERAMEIFTKLHLNNRKKSAYFADQIRFLQKLAINNKHKS